MVGLEDVIVLKDCLRRHHMEIPDTQVWWVKVRLSCVEARLLVSERTILVFTTL